MKIYIFLVKIDRDIHGISTLKDNVIAVMLILIAVFASTIAIWTNLSTPAGSKA